MDMHPIITKRPTGEYSTAVVSGGDVIETMWFGNDGTAVTVGRTIISKSDAAKSHIKSWEEK